MTGSPANADARRGPDADRSAVDTGPADDIDPADDLPAEVLALAGTNINAQTYLATDYLNHFNEIVMFLEMIPDMPDMFEEAKLWAPKGYADHFRDSSFKDKELAVRAYDAAPPRYRRMFDQTVARMNDQLVAGLVRIDAAIVAGNDTELAFLVQQVSRSTQRLIDVCSSIIHGNVRTMSQTQIDEALAF